MRAVSLAAWPSLRAPAARRSWAPAFLLVLALCGCHGAEWYRRAADKEAYGLISDKAATVPGMERGFSLEEVVDKARRGELAPISLAEAVMLAAANNRDFQQQRENVFLKALELSYQRYRFRPHLSGALSGLFSKSGGEESVSAEGSLGLSGLLASGAEVGLTLSTEFLRFLSGDPRQSLGSLLRFTLRQPLGRGAWRKIVQENLVQAERDLVYQVRSFVRYRREFFVSVAADFFRVLQQKDVVANERMNMENLAAARERAQMLFEAGRLPGMQVDQAEQDELRARDSWVRAQQTYRSRLDEFKIKLGLPAEIPLELDSSELDRLRAAGMLELRCTREEAVRIALANRLDLATAADAVADAERKVAVARDALGPDIELALSADLSTDDPRSSYSGEFTLEPALDRLQERNNYRRALIELDRKRRNYELQRDRVVQQVWAAWRRLEEARASHRIQLRSVELARQRVDSTTLLIEAGRAEMRDLLDAQAALVRARNNLVGTLVDYRIAMLELWRDMGVLGFRNGTFVQEEADAELTGSN